jgi:hypothetical protein
MTTITPIATNWTRPDHRQGVRFVLNRDGATYTWIWQDLDLMTEKIMSSNLTIQDVTYLGGVLFERGWR